MSPLPTSVVNLPTSGTDIHGPIEVPHADFRAGLPAGHYHVIVNPERAQKYVRHRLFVTGIALPLLGVGTALGVSGYPWVGIPLIALGILLPRLIKSHAPKILLHLAMQDAKVYREAIEFEILEVRVRA